MVFFILFLVSTVFAEESRCYKDIIPPDTCLFKPFSFFTKEQRELNECRKKYSDEVRKLLQEQYTQEFSCDAPYADAHCQEILKAAAHLSEINPYDITLKYEKHPKFNAFHRLPSNYIYVADGALTQDFYNKLLILTHELHHYRHDCNLTNAVCALCDVHVTHDQYERYKEIAADTDAFEKTLELIRKVLIA